MPGEGELSNPNHASSACLQCPSETKCKGLSLRFHHITSASEKAGGFYVSSSFTARGQQQVSEVQVKPLLYISSVWQILWPINSRSAIFMAKHIIDQAMDAKTGTISILLLDWARAFDRIRPEAMVVAIKRFVNPRRVCRHGGRCFVGKDIFY